jgi:hypothetical protein
MRVSATVSETPAFPRGTPVLRRVFIVVLATAVVTTAPAWAAAKWHSQYVAGTHTSKRSHSSSCRFEAGPRPGSLGVDCHRKGTATLRYDFHLPGGVTGRPMGKAHYLRTSGMSVHQTLTRPNRMTLRVTVRISGSGDVTVTSVDVGCYA